MEIKEHPIYNLYEVNTNGEYRIKGNTKWLNGGKGPKGFLVALLCDSSGKNKKKIFIHRMMWELFKNTIPDGYIIDHIDNNIQNNKLTNLQCIKKNSKKKDNTDFLNKIRECAHIKNDKNIKGINLTNNEEFIFINKSQAAKFYGCSPAMVYCILNGKAKFFSKNITFEYTDDEPNKIFQNGKIGKKKLITDEEKRKRHSLAMKKYRNKKKAEKLIQKTD